MSMKEVKRDIRKGIEEAFKTSAEFITASLMAEIPNSISLNMRPLKNYIEGDRTVPFASVLKSSIEVRYPSDPEIQRVVEFRQNMYNTF